MTSIRRRVTIEPRGPAAAIVLTDDDVAELGGGKRAAVVVGIGGRTARLRLARMGGEYLIGLSKAARADLAVDAGDEVDAQITLDEQPRTVTVPAELQTAFSGDPAAEALFRDLPYTAQKEFADWVAGAAKPETRERRVSETVVMLHDGRRRT